VLWRPDDAGAREDAVDGSMTAHKALAQAFFDAFDAADLDAIDALLAEDFVWHTATIADDETEPRPFQSRTLRSEEVAVLAKPLKDKVETLAVFEHLFAAGAQDAADHFHLRVVSMTAEDDRVAVEALGDARNPSNGRHYRNLYFILLQVRDGKIVRYKEYQDTLHIYDVWHAD
jgi:ketosteroid isomerase-like protein